MIGLIDKSLHLRDQYLLFKITYVTFFAPDDSACYPTNHPPNECFTSQVSIFPNEPSSTWVIPLKISSGISCISFSPFSLLRMMKVVSNRPQVEALTLLSTCIVSTPLTASPTEVERGIRTALVRRFRLLVTVVPANAPRQSFVPFCLSKGSTFFQFTVRVGLRLGSHQSMDAPGVKTQPSDEEEDNDLADLLGPGNKGPTIMEAPASGRYAQHQQRVYQSYYQRQKSMSCCDYVSAYISV